MYWLDIDCTCSCNAGYTGVSCLVTSSEGDLRSQMATLALSHLADVATTAASAVQVRTRKENVIRENDVS